MGAIAYRPDLTTYRSPGMANSQYQAPRAQLASDLHWQATPLLAVIAWISCLVGTLLSVEIWCSHGHENRASRVLSLVAGSICFGVVAVWISQCLVDNSILIQDPIFTGASSNGLNANPFLPAPSGYLHLEHKSWSAAVCCVASSVLTLIGIASSSLSLPPSKCLRILKITAGILLISAATLSTQFIDSASIVGYRVDLNGAYTSAGVLITCCLIGVTITDLLLVMDETGVSRTRKVVWGITLSLAIMGGRLLALLGNTIALRLEDLNTPKASRLNTLYFAVIAACIALTTLCALIALEYRKSRTRLSQAKQIGLALAAFDGKGNLMIDSKGELPYIKITDTDVLPTVLEELTVDSDLFQSIWRISHDWKAIMHCIDGMRSRVQASPFYTSWRDQDAVHTKAWTKSTSSLFKQAFCVAADRISGQIGVTHDELGKLFVQPLKTGTIGCGKRDSQRKITVSTGTGRILVLVQRIHKASKKTLLESRGYRFSELNRVAHSITKRFGRSFEETQEVLYSMRASTSQPRPFLPNSTHIGAFILKSNVGSSQMDVLVQKQSITYLPMVQVAHLALPDSILHQLDSLGGKTMAECQYILHAKHHRNGDAESRMIAGHFLHALQELEKLVDEPWIAESVFCLQLFKVPIYESMAARSAARLRYSPPVASHANLLAFTLITDIHDSGLKRSGGTLTYTPLATFTNQQKILQSPEGDETFRKSIVEELQTAWSATMPDSGVASWRSSVTQFDLALESLPKKDPVQISTKEYASSSRRSSTPSAMTISSSETISPVKTKASIFRPTSTVFVDDLVHVAYLNFQERRRMGWQRR